MSRKLCALASALVLVLSWLSLGLPASAANADTPGFVVIPYTSCDTAHGTWTAYWQFTNNKYEPGTLSGTGPLDSFYGAAGEEDDHLTGTMTASLSKASQSLGGDSTRTMTWADDTTQEVTVPTVLARPDCNHPGISFTARAACNANGSWTASVTLTNLKKVAGRLMQSWSAFDRTYGPAGSADSSFTVTATVDHGQSAVVYGTSNTYIKPIIFSWGDNTGQLVTPLWGVSRPTCVHPKAVIFHDKRGTKKDAYVIPSMKGVLYTSHGKQVRAGTHHARGTVTIRALAASGYGLLGTVTWSHRFKTR